MAKKKKRRKLIKPTGITGPVRLITGDEGTEIDFQQVQFPQTKEGVEKFIVDSFLVTVRRRGLLQFPDSAKQNALDDFDFTINTPSGHLALELMEIALFEHSKGSHNNASGSYRGYDMAEYILSKILHKSARYVSSEKSGIILLLYSTDWRFIPSQTVIALLQYWTLHTGHSFKEIYWFKPALKDEGIVEIIYPTPKDFWNGFEPERYRENITYNFDPRDIRLL